MFRLECIKRVGYFDETLTFIQDTQMWLRLGKCFKFGFLDLCLLRRRLHEKSLATVQSSRNYVLEHIKMLENLGNWVDLTPVEQSAVDRLNANYCHAAGYLDFTEYLMPSSRRYFWKSLRLRFAVKPLLYLCFTLMPGDLTRAFRSLKRRMSSSVSGVPFKV